MRRLTHNRGIALLLGLWVALAPALFVFPAAAMAVEMSRAGNAGSDCCTECPEVDWDCSVCSVMCRIAGQPATMPEAEQARHGAAVTHRPSPGPAPVGHAPPPDPAPPKSVSSL